MLKRVLIYSGIVLLPFYEVVMLWLFPHKEMTFPDTRVPREILSLNICLVVGLIALYEGKLARIPNKAFLAFLAVALIAIPLAPPYGFMVKGELLKAFWFYKPLFIMTTFLLFTSAVSAMDLHLEFGRISKLFIYIGLTMAGYVLLQSFGIDQVFGILNDTNPDALSTPMSYLGGTLGHPTIVSPFIAMMVPFCLGSEKYIYAALMALTVLITKSDIALAAMITGIVLFYACRNRTAMNLLYLTIVLGCLIFGLALALGSPWLEKLPASGRVAAWKSILTDNISPLEGKKSGVTYSFTGKGLGSYEYVFPGQYSSRFHQAHNSLLQALYETGIIGAVLLFLAFISHFKHCSRGLFEVISGWNVELRVLMASALVLVLASLGTIVNHLGIFWFFFSVIIGMTYGILRQMKVAI